MDEKGGGEKRLSLRMTHLCKIPGEVEGSANFIKIGRAGR